MLGTEVSEGFLMAGPPEKPGDAIAHASPGVWEMIVEAGRDPVTGRLVVSSGFASRCEDGPGGASHRGPERSTCQDSATVDELCQQWLVKLERKGRSAKRIHGYRQTYRHNVGPTLGSAKVSKVTTKMLSDLYGEHQRRGFSPRSVYQIHATITSMMMQACRWGWRDSKPAQWADPPSVPNSLPVVPTPEEVLRLVEATQESKRPEYTRAIFLSATTGLRRGEICALRRNRDID